MKAAVIVRKGDPHSAFEIREVEKPTPKPHEVCIKVEAFGLNYADVMARLGLYQDAPKFPAVLGYEIVGHIDSIGTDVKNLKIGQRVVGMTRFGGYAEYAVTDARAVAVIPDTMTSGVAAALGTQYNTAYYSAVEVVNLHAGDHVLVHAAAGGVGTALVQLAKWKGCIVYGTAGSQEKLQYLKEHGVDYPINYRTQDFEKVIDEIVGSRGLDVVFDSVGGDYVKKGMRLLGSGGRMLCYGASRLSNTTIFQKIGILLGFGWYSPISLMTNCKHLLGVNMLRIADDRPLVIQRCLEKVVQLTDEGILKPVVGGSFTIDQIGAAHALLESRKSKGKIIVTV